MSTRTTREEALEVLLRQKQTEITYLQEQVELLTIRCNDRLAVQWEQGKKIGKLEHQRNEARRKHGVLRRKVRQIVFVQRAAIADNSRHVCERALLEKELAGLRDRLNAFEQAQAARVEKAVAETRKLNETSAEEKAGAAFVKVEIAEADAKRLTAILDKLEAEKAPA